MRVGTERCPRIQSGGGLVGQGTRMWGLSEGGDSVQAAQGPEL